MKSLFMKRNKQLSIWHDSKISELEDAYHAFLLLLCRIQESDATVKKSALNKKFDNAKYCAENAMLWAREYVIHIQNIKN